MKDVVDIKPSKFFEIIKYSPLANDSIEIEEAAIWLDIQGMSNAKDIWKIFTECTKFFSTHNDWIFYQSMQTNHSAFELVLPFRYASTTIFKNIFKLLFQTNYLDKECINEKFIAKAKKMKLRFKSKSMTRYDLNDNKYINLNKRYLDLYEIFAELVDRLEKKINSL